jgi:hypothetical protein
MNSTAKVQKKIDLQLNRDELTKAVQVLNGIREDSGLLTPEIKTLVHELSAHLPGFNVFQRIRDAQIPVDHIRLSELPSEKMYKLTRDLCEIFNKEFDNWDTATSCIMMRILTYAHDNLTYPPAAQTPQKEVAQVDDEVITVQFAGISDLAWMISGLSQAIKAAIEDTNNKDMMGSLSYLMAILSEALNNKTFE